MHFLFALFLAIAVRRFSYTLLGKGGASTNSLVSLALIDITEYVLEIVTGAGIVVGYLAGLTYSMNPTLGIDICLGKYLIICNKTCESTT